jgi:NDP-sugar pyrophosphorylase family protein
MASDTQKLEIFCISASRRNDAASLFRTQLAHCRSECPLLQHEGYLNSLANPRDLRQFAIDILIRQTQTCPAGKEIKPGVWTAAGAMIEKGARVLAPAFVGAMARIRSGAVITRCSSIERHAEIDCGTVVENSTVLPYSYVGAGLDLAHSVAGMGRIVNLHRDVSVTIVDTKLISSMSVASGKRLITSAAEVLTYLPRLAFQGIFAGTKAEQPDLQATLRQTSPALGNAAGFETSACDTEASHKFPNMVVARRYGHQ